MPTRIPVICTALCAVFFGLLLNLSGGAREAGHRAARPLAAPPMELGINLSGLATFTRQQVFANMIAQSYWFTTRGGSWSAMEQDQLDADGWVRYLETGQRAPRPLVLPPAPFAPVDVLCTYKGQGAFSAGGVARMTESRPGSFTLHLSPRGDPEEGGWIELVATDPRDPARKIDCRTSGTPADARFDPAFIAFASQFKVLRFLDWQRTNENAQVRWADRPRPSSASQVTLAGTSVEDMIELANIAGVDPWFTLPYHADPDYVRGFAQLVHDRLSSERRVYVELGNEVWNDIFPAARDAAREGLALGLGEGVPRRAQMERYAERMVEVMKIWTAQFADRPKALVRVGSSQHADPALARIILGHGDSAKWIDALATAPYIWLDLEGLSPADVDTIFARMPESIERTWDMAEDNRRIAMSHGKRYIAYEGGQHLVTDDLELARAIQRDPRMADVYRDYLEGWRDRFGDTLMLYASTGPIAKYGAWGLREYAGQPLAEAPKYRAVRQFMGTGG